ncbi:hypothetical protein NW762_013876 [Fusarium torreyae]|uniref:Uncharacterized protein n=1 Tax=Fusarium torreyae TaxID=1237075 RepID=A0A9W8V9W4_9HYPO|nr:hypothetical protein NW762_013876 [Fusarium torreyae]
MENTDRLSLEPHADRLEICEQALHKLNEAEQSLSNSIKTLEEDITEAERRSLWKMVKGSRLTRKREEKLKQLEEFEERKKALIAKLKIRDRLKELCEVNNVPQEEPPAESGRDSRRPVLEPDISEQTNDGVDEADGPGSSSVHCDAGCQPEYGTCNAPRILKRKRASPCKPSKSTISSGPETTTLPASSAGTSSVEDSTNTIPTTLSTSSLTTTSQVLEPESTSSTALSTHDTSEFSTSTETSSLEDSTTTIHTTSVLPSTTSTEAQQPQQTSSSMQAANCTNVTIHNADEAKEVAGDYKALTGELAVYSDLNETISHDGVEKNPGRYDIRTQGHGINITLGSEHSTTIELEGNINNIERGFGMRNTVVGNVEAEDLNDSGMLDLSPSNSISNLRLYSNDSLSGIKLPLVATSWRELGLPISASYNLNPTSEHRDTEKENERFWYWPEGDI